MARLTCSNVEIRHVLYFIQKSVHIKIEKKRFWRHRAIRTETQSSEHESMQQSNGETDGNRSLRVLTQEQDEKQHTEKSLLYIYIKAKG